MWSPCGEKGLSQARTASGRLPGRWAGATPQGLATCRQGTPSSVLCWCLEPQPHTEFQEPTHASGSTLAMEHESKGSRKCE